MRSAPAATKLIPIIAANAAPDPVRGSLPGTVTGAAVVGTVPPWCAWVLVVKIVVEPCSPNVLVVVSSGTVVVDSSTVVVVSSPTVVDVSSGTVVVESSTVVDVSTGTVVVESSTVVDVSTGTVVVESSTVVVVPSYTVVVDWPIVVVVSSSSQS